MRLTFVNFLMRKKRRMPIFKFRGKHREVKEVEIPVLHTHRKALELQERNMLILRHPYLTVEQSKGHMSEFRDPNYSKNRFNQTRNEKFNKTYTWAEQLSHLRCNDRWD